MAFSALGINQIKINKQAKVTVICTGDEIIDDAMTPLKHGQIRNSNAPYLKTMLPSLGADLSSVTSISDNPEAFQKLLTEIIAADAPPNIIITTGGVSAGRWDHVPNILKNLGAKIIFHKVAIRPGKPILFATLNDLYFFGLPGNPISGAVGLRFFVEPLLRQIRGIAAPEEAVFASLTKPIKKVPSFRCFYKAITHINAQGEAKVEILEGQESFKMHSFIKANSWAILEEDCDGYEENALIKTYPLNPENTE